MAKIIAEMLVETVTITGSTLTVELDDEGSSQFSRAIAGAVRIQRIEADRRADDDCHAAAGSLGWDRAAQRWECH